MPNWLPMICAVAAARPRGLEIKQNLSAMFSQLQRCGISRGLHLPVSRKRGIATALKPSNYVPFGFSVAQKVHRADLCDPGIHKAYPTGGAALQAFEAEFPAERDKLMLV